MALNAQSRICSAINMYSRYVTLLSKLGGIIAALLLAVAVVVVCQMIVMRYFLNASTVWQTEFVTFSLVASTFLGSGFVLLRKGHVGVDLLPRMLGSSGRYLEILANLLSMSFLLLLAWFSWHYFYEAWQENWTTSTVWALPLWIPLLPMPIGIGILLLQYIAQSLQLIFGLEVTTATDVYKPNSTVGA